MKGIANSISSIEENISPSGYKKGASPIKVKSNNTGTIIQGHNTVVWLFSKKV